METPSERLSPDQERLVARLGRSQRWAAMAGLALALAGLAYAGWGLSRFDPRGDPRLDPGFDRPVAKLAFLFVSYQGALDYIEPETSTEQFLLETLQGGMKFGSGMALMLLRLLIGTIVAVAGMAAMTVVMERRRLLAIIERLRAAGVT